MNKICIAHLYYDLLNLYGENGNIKALENELKNQGFEVEIVKKTVDEKLEFENYDLVYIGAGTEDNQKIVIPHLLQYKEIIKDCIDNNKFFFITGNSIEFFGKYIEYTDEKIETLNIFPYYIKQEEKRMIDESIMKCSFIDKPIIGFQNQSTAMYENENGLFNIVKSINSNPNSEYEGVKFNNFYGTYLIGPILARNPYLLKYLVEELIKSKDKEFEFNEFDLEQNIQAYDNFINNFYKGII